MGVFMLGRLQGIAVLVLLARWSSWALLKFVLNAAALAWSVWYVFLLWKTLSAVVLLPMVWNIAALFVVNIEYTPEQFFRVDGAPDEIVAKREAALKRMSVDWKERWPKMREMSAFLKEHFSDLRFTASGVKSIFAPFQKVVNDALDPCTLVERSEGSELVDVDGNRFLDVSGAYGVNVLGFTRFKQFMREGHEIGEQLGPVLGPMHPKIIENIEIILKLTGKDEVSFHMSGTEAVMCAVQQARFHTQRRLIAVFTGAYHGWWDGVMQGAGNDRYNADCLILKDMCPQSLELLRLRAGDIAAVLVNPMQGFHPGGSARTNASSVESKAGAQNIERYGAWLKQLRWVCTAGNILLIFDEVWTFQLGPRGAQEHYGVNADLLVFGKALGGGYAVGAVCGPKRLMERRDPERPMRVSYVIGTFSAHPTVVGSMNACLRWIQSPEAQKEFDGLTERVARWQGRCNKALEKADLPISVAAYRTIWTVHYHQSGAYHFLFQYYLRNAGLQLSWVGTGKLLLNLEFSDADLDRLTEILVAAGKAFKADGWWWEDGAPPKVTALAGMVGQAALRHFTARALALVGQAPEAKAKRA